MARDMAELKWENTALCQQLDEVAKDMRVGFSGVVEGLEKLERRKKKKRVVEEDKKED